jgi:GT2 family glycosyltransferase
MREAKGEYIFSLDDDAFLSTSEIVSRVVARMEAEPEVAVVTCRVLEGGQGAPEGPDLGHYTNSFHGAGHCMRKAVFGQTGGYREYAFREYEEAEWALRILDHGCRIFYFPSAVVVHEISAQGRDLRLWHTSGPRNRLLGSWVNEPFPWWVVSTARNVTLSLINGLRRGTLSHVLAGFAAAVKELPRVMSIRCPVSSKTMRLHLALSKRRITGSDEVKKLYKAPPALLEILLSKRS